MVVWYISSMHAYMTLEALQDIHYYTLQAFSNITFGSSGASSYSSYSSENRKYTFSYSKVVIVIAFTEGLKRGGGGGGSQLS